MSLFLRLLVFIPVSFVLMTIVGAAIDGLLRYVGYISREAISEEHKVRVAFLATVLSLVPAVLQGFSWGLAWGLIITLVFGGVGVLGVGQYHKNVAVRGFGYLLFTIAVFLSVFAGVMLLYDIGLGLGLTLTLFVFGAMTFIWGLWYLGLLWILPGFVMFIAGAFFSDIDLGFGFLLLLFVAGATLFFRWIVNGILLAYLFNREGGPTSNFFPRTRLVIIGLVMVATAVVLISFLDRWVPSLNG